MKLGLAAICAALSAACNVSGTVGASFLSSSTVDADGGSLSIAAAQSVDLGGARIDFPAGALAQPTTIAASPADSLASGDWVAAGPAVDWDPEDLSLAVPASFALPGQLPAGRDADDLFVLENSPAGAGLIYGAGNTYDGILLHFTASHLGTFQVATGKACTDRDGCASGHQCIHGGCRPDGDASRSRRTVSPLR